jgi:hypothetical protein
MVALPDIAVPGNAASIALPVRGNNGIVEYSGGPEWLPACRVPSSVSRDLPGQHPWRTGCTDGAPWVRSFILSWMQAMSWS